MEIEHSEIFEDIEGESLKRIDYESLIWRNIDSNRILASRGEFELYLDGVRNVAALMAAFYDKEFIDKEEKIEKKFRIKAHNLNYNSGDIDKMYLRLCSETGKQLTREIILLIKRCGMIKIGISDFIR